MGVQVLGERFKYSFPAVNISGQMHHVEVWAEILDAGTVDDLGAEAEGLLRLQTSTGVNVIYLGKGKYQISRTGDIITSDDPTAL